METKLKFAGAVGLQCLILAVLIVSRQMTLSTGQRVLLQTAPVDPRSLFQGDYVILSYEISTLPTSLPGDAATLEQGETVHVTLRRQGRFWNAVAAHRQRPSAGPDAAVLRGRVLSARSDQLRVEYGIESYFVPEGTGRELERWHGRGLEVEISIDRRGRAAIRQVHLPEQQGSDGAVERPPSAADRARFTACDSHLKQRALGMLMYVQDHDERFPPADRWTDGIAPYLKSDPPFRCPGEPGSRYGYAFNRTLGGRSLHEIERPAEIPMLFDSTLGVRNAADQGQSWPPGGRHVGRNTVAFADGHVKALSEKPPFALADAAPAR